MYPLGKRVFISYRGDDVQRARLLRAALEGNGLCKHAVLFEPDQLAVDGEILLPYEFVELMEFITDEMARCDSFVYLDRADYWQSYFTQAEVVQWRRFRKSPTLHSAVIDAQGQGGLSDPIPLQPMAESEKKLWARFSVGINRNLQGHHSVGFTGGRFARNCYLVPCRSCGEHFLVSQEAMEQVLRGTSSLRCPHRGCGAGDFRVSEGERRGNFYRKPIRIQQPRRTPLRVLGSMEILGLLMTNDSLPQFPLVAIEGETLRCDLGKLGIVYGGMAAAAGIALLLAGLAGTGDPPD